MEVKRCDSYEVDPECTYHTVVGDMTIVNGSGLGYASVVTARIEPGEVYQYYCTTHPNTMHGYIRSHDSVYSSHS